LSSAPRAANVRSRTQARPYSLDPREEAHQTGEAEFPVEGLKSKRHSHERSLCHRASSERVPGI